MSDDDRAFLATAAPTNTVNGVGNKRGEPEGINPSERVGIWLDRAPNVGDGMTWVGKNYSLAQLKADVRVLLTPLDSQGNQL